MKFTFGNLPTIGWDESTSKLVRLAQLAEEAGFDRFGVSDWKFYQDCFVVMTACLQATSALEVASLVTEPYVRNPAVTAAAMATMADLSGGRAIFGIGAGVESSSRVWSEPWGFERPRPLAAVREAIDISRRMWQGESVTLHGEVLRVDDAILRFETPDVPVMVAARSPRMISLAGELGDIVHLASFFVNDGHHRDNLEHVRKGAERAGRHVTDLEIDISMPCSISADGRAARDAAKRPAAIGILWTAAEDEYRLSSWRRPPQFSVPDSTVEALSAWNFRRSPQLPDDLAALITDDVLAEFSLAGTAEECAARVKELASRLPEVTGIRIYAVPPVAHGKPLYEGYMDMMEGLHEMIRLTNDGDGSS
jgi:5,10-methylenetetrahydromethanopterin reductase